MRLSKLMRKIINKNIILKDLMNRFVNLNELMNISEIPINICNNCNSEIIKPINHRLDSNLKLCPYCYESISFIQK